MGPFIRINRLDIFSSFIAGEKDAMLPYNLSITGLISKCPV
jgi:hypothetical protein